MAIRANRKAAVQKLSVMDEGKGGQPQIGHIEKKKDPGLRRGNVSTQEKRSCKKKRQKEGKKLWTQKFIDNLLLGIGAPQSNPRKRRESEVQFKQ